MSRTFKDRPYWVQVNDPKSETSEYHDHHHFGKPVYQSRRVYDEDGNPVYEYQDGNAYRYEYKGVGYVASFRLPQFDVRYAGSDEWVFVGGRENIAGNIEAVRPHEPEKTRANGFYRYHKTERVLVGYRRDYCDIDEPRKHRSHKEDRLLGNCERNLSGSRRWRCSCCSNGRGFSAEDRTRSRDTLRAAAKAYRGAGGDEDWWGDEVEGFESPTVCWW